MHILLVEDNLHDIVFVQHVLQYIQPPIQLSVVQDGQHALAFLFKQAPYTQVLQPDIVLLDINMPDKSGFDVLAALEHDPISGLFLLSSSRPARVPQISIAAMSWARMRTSKSLWGWITCSR